MVNWEQVINEVEPEPEPSDLDKAIAEHRQRWDQIHARERMIQAQQGDELRIDNDVL